MAPQVAGQIVELSVKDNQFVRKGDLLMVIDPTDYKIAVSLNEAAVQQAQANAENAERESTASPARSTSRMRRPMGKGLPMFTRSLPGCVWRNGSRCAST